MYSRQVYNPLKSMGVAYKGLQIECEKVTN